jgi:Tol biopolymer transport system component
VKADGSNTRHLALADPTLMLGCATWSRDGMRLLAEGWDDTTLGREGLYLVNSRDGCGLQRVTTSTGGYHDVPGSYPPDGKQIAYVHATNDGDEWGELWVIDDDGGHPRRVGDGKVSFGASFSPDGRSILAEWLGRLLVYDDNDLGAAPRSIDTPGLIALGGSWSPDGRALVFSAVDRRGEKAEIYTMNLDGTDLWQVTRTPESDDFGGWALPPA